MTIGADTGDIVSLTGGSGDDTFAMTSGLATTDVLVGGAGTDTVSVTGVADDASLDLSTYNFTSIETFSVKVLLVEPMILLISLSLPMQLVLAT